MILQITWNFNFLILSFFHMLFVFKIFLIVLVRGGTIKSALNGKFVNTALSIIYKSFQINFKCLLKTKIHNKIHFSVSINKFSVMSYLT